jgi:hypothetical protein
VSVKKLPDYAAFDKNVDRKSATFTPPQSHPVIEARRPLLCIDFCWCQEGDSFPSTSLFNEPAVVHSLKLTSSSRSFGQIVVLPEPFGLKFGQI